MGASSQRESYYAVLGISPDATAEDVKHAYRRRVRELHPDLKVTATSLDQFKAVRRAYEVLANPRERDRYNLLLGVGPYAGMTRFYRRSFEHLFDCLFSSLHTALNNTGELAAQVENAQRKAG